MVNIISRLQESGGSLNGNLTYSAALIDNDTGVELCFDNDILNNSCIRVGPGIINITTDTTNNH